VHVFLCACVRATLQEGQVLEGGRWVGATGGSTTLDAWEGGRQLHFVGSEEWCVPACLQACYPAGV
jgi:hypothetical protein